MEIAETLPSRLHQEGTIVCWKITCCLEHRSPARHPPMKLQSGRSGPPSPFTPSSRGGTSTYSVVRTSPR